MKRKSVALILCCSISLGFGLNTARAELCTVDAVPAATLLIPYFRVDLAQCGQPTGENTLFTVLNADAAPALAHVTVWTDWSVPTFSFNTYLTGYDIQEFDLKALLCHGTIPNTGLVNPVVDSTALAKYQQWHQGKSDGSGNCASSPRTSDIAIGYVTVDSVDSEVTGNPSNGDSYLDKLSNFNQFVGHVYHKTFETVEEVDVNVTPVDQPKIPKKRKCRRKPTAKKRAKCFERRRILKLLLPLEPKVDVVTNDVQKSQGLRGYPAVHVEADDSFTGTASGKTFYGRYTTGGTDNREPLSTTFAALYGQSSASHEYDLIVWREGDAQAAPVTCGTTPSWHPLGTTQVVAFDSAEDPTEIFPAFPNETQLFPNFLSVVPYTSGWVFLNLNFGTGLRQGWVGQSRDFVFDGAGVVPLTSACESVVP